MAQRPVYYGGQAVLEGVMIRGPHSMAVACRRPDGEIVVRGERLGGVYTSVVRRIPLVRGMIVMWETLALGMRSLMFSSNVAVGEEAKEISPGAIWGTVLLSLGLVAALFFAGPVLLTGWLDDRIGNGTLVVLIEGLIRLALVVGYVGLIGLLPDIRRVYAYHGAEHKSIHALEHGDPLVPDRVQRYSTAHVRCGTSFLLTVVVVSVLVFAALGSPEWWWRVLSRIVLIPVIAAISYEVIRLGGAFESSRIVRVLMWPNLALQALTTRQPDEGQVEVALRALGEVLALEGAEAEAPQRPA
ncbi:MAG TPA: DUF1385 domain-containing protein [Dehalococcoidia bacterium]|nr:DUF1385 domain-containing protein [Dehalococcoidia bacterium]